MNGVGFKGSEASHSLRYQFAREQFAKYLEALGDKKRLWQLYRWTLATEMAEAVIASRSTCVRGRSPPVATVRLFWRISAHPCD